MRSAMNGVVFQTSTSTTAHIAVSGFAVQATGEEMIWSAIKISLSTPNWSCSIQPHILAETMVGIAQGIRTAARTMARPLNSAFSTNATMVPRTVSIETDTTENQTV